MRLKLKLVIAVDPSENCWLNVHSWSQALSSEVHPALRAGGNTSIWSLSGVQSFAHWNPISEGVSLAGRSTLLAFLLIGVSLSLISLRLVAIKSSVSVSAWASFGTERVSKSGKS